MRAQNEGDEAESPFADLLDSCGLSDGDSADLPQAPGETVAADAPVEAKAQTDLPIVPEKAQKGADDAAEAFSAELLLLLAMTGQPANDAKQAKPAKEAVSGAVIAPDAQPDSQPKGDASEAPAAPVIPAPPVPAPAIVAVAAPLSVEIPVAPPEVAADSTTPVPELAAVTSATAAPAAKTDAPVQTSVDAPGPEKSPQSADAIEATLAAQADKNKNLVAEKPTSASAERTLDTPAAFRSAADAEAPAAKTENPKGSVPEETGVASKETDRAAKASAGEAPRGATDVPDAKPREVASQPSPEPEAGANAQGIPPLPQANPGAQTVAQPVAQPAVIQPGPAGHVPVTGLAVEIAAHAQAGKNRFEIRLDPPELGRIDVRLDVGSDGQVTSHLRVERAETLDLLRRDAPMLERALQQAGLKTSDNGLQFSLRDQSSFSWQQQQQQPTEMPDMARLVVSDEMTPVETPRQYGRLAGLGSGVDIRV